mmetsp:Transcript_1523/g.5229  ORF Transcript_1523/g.5229 Transcript_1523/m.5229 type:complete len:226 (-) Transcript_1523:359-1036(-)
MQAAGASGGWSVLLVALEALASTRWAASAASAASNSLTCRWCFASFWWDVMASRRSRVMPARAHLPLSPACRQILQPIICADSLYSSQGRPAFHLGLKDQTCRLGLLLERPSGELVPSSPRSEDAGGPRGVDAAVGVGAMATGVAKALGGFSAAGGGGGGGASLMVGLCPGTSSIADSRAAAAIFSENVTRCCRSFATSSSARSARSSAASRRASDSASRASSEG